MALRSRIAKVENQQGEDQSPHRSQNAQPLDLNAVLHNGRRDPQSIMQLQRTIGNRATQSMLQRHTPVIQRSFGVNGTNWEEAKTLDATGGIEGVTGVFFIRNKNGEQLVLKPAHGGARTEMATTIMQDVGVEASETRNIALGSAEGKKLVKVMNSLISKKKATNTAKAKWASFETKGFDGLLVMESMGNLTTFAKMTDRPDKGGLNVDFPKMLKQMWDNGFWFDMGRIHAADMIMGNSDRLERMNVKNFFVNMETGRAVGLDLDLEAVGFEAATSDKFGEESSIKGQEYKDWVTYAIEGADGKRNFTDKKGAIKKTHTGNRGGELDPTNQKLLTDQTMMGQKIDDLRDLMADIIRGEKTQEMLDRADAWEAMNWNDAKGLFMHGVRQGMAVLNAKIEGGAYDQKAQELSQQFGPDPQIEPIVFKLRNMHYQQARAGMDEGELRTKLEIYAEWLHTGQGFNPFAQENIVQQNIGRRNRRAMVVQ